ncbi:DNA-binding response regulator [Cytophagales bacterium WSM2-2]|nr:DNA-binding response regulator [Cytophagales bacterium WSM2-2]
MNKHKIVLVDDHSMIRTGVKDILKHSEEMMVVGEADSGAKAIRMYEEIKPDLIMLDISLPDINGMDVSRQILEFDPAANILMLSMHADEDYVCRCIQHGVKGYVVKDESAQELERAVSTILEGKTYFGRKAQEVILNKYKRTAVGRKEKSDNVKLTPREIEIINLIDTGLTSNEMADKLFISPRTVETHRANLMKKFGVKNSIELVKKARSLHIISESN